MKNTQNCTILIRNFKHTADISYTNTPNAHQSTALLYPFDKIISGAKYSIKYKDFYRIRKKEELLFVPGVPHNVQVRPKTDRIKRLINMIQISYMMLICMFLKTNSIFILWYYIS